MAGQAAPNFDNTLAQGGDFPVTPTHHEAGAADRGRPLADMGPHHCLFGVLLTWLLIAVVLMAIGALAGGCSDAQRNASADNLAGLSSQLQSTRDALVGSPTTRPSPVVTMVEAAVPASAPYIELAGTALGLVAFMGGVAANWLRTKPTIESLTQTAASLTQAVVDHRAAIAEVVGDVRTYVQPTVPYSHMTAKLVADVAGLTAAAPASATVALTDLHVVPADMHAAPAAALRPAEPTG